MLKDLLTFSWVSESARFHAGSPVVCQKRPIYIKRDLYIWKKTCNTDKDLLSVKCSMLETCLVSKHAAFLNGGHEISLSLTPTLSPIYSLSYLSSLSHTHFSSYLLSLILTLSHYSLSYLLSLAPIFSHTYSLSYWHAYFDRKKPPPGGCSLLVGFHIKTRRKRTPPEEPPPKLIMVGGGSSGGVLFLWVLDLETIHQRNSPRGGVVLPINFPHTYSPHIYSFSYLLSIVHTLSHTFSLSY